MHRWFCSVALLICLPVVHFPGDEESSPLSPRNAHNDAALELRMLSAHELVAPLRRAALPLLGRVFARIAWERLGSPDTPWPLDSSEERGTARFLFPFDSDGRAPLQADRVVEGLMQDAGEEAWSANGGTIQAVGGTLIATQSRDVLTGAQRRLEQMRLQFAPRYRCDYVLYRADGAAGDDAPERLALDAADELYRNLIAGRAGTVLFTGRDEGRPGDELSMGRRARMGMQSEIDVEIASGCAIADPVLTRFDVGHGVQLTLTPGPDGKSVALFGLFTRCEPPSAVLSEQLNAELLKAVERIELSQVQSAFSMLLPGDGGVVLRPGGTEAPELRVLLVVRREDPWPQSEPNRLCAHLGLLSWPLLTCADEPLAGIERPALQIDHLREMVTTVIEGDPEGEASVDFTDLPCITVKASAQRTAAAGALLQFLARERSRTFVVELIRESRPAGDPAGAWQPLGAPIRVTCLGHRLGFAQAGREFLFTGDYDVEVAQQSAIADPQTFACFDGVQMVAAVQPAADVVRVSVAALDRSILGFREIESASPRTGPIRVPDLREVTFQRAFRMKPGETRVLGDGPEREIPGRGRFETRLSLRLIER